MKSNEYLMILMILSSILYLVVGNALLIQLGDILLSSSSQMASFFLIMSVIPYLLIVAAIPCFVLGIGLLFKRRSSFESSLLFKSFMFSFALIVSFWNTPLILFPALIDFLIVMLLITKRGDFKK